MCAVSTRLSVFCFFHSQELVHWFITNNTCGAEPQALITTQNFVLLAFHVGDASTTLSKRQRCFRSANATVIHRFSSDEKGFSVLL
ncbi:hypothetical protein FisN_2Hu050 [Fistulifera solaris]|uniref:Uncharacterized protein n=1 Tax=Fistulifera solaris TaxID=1519565 RepID=A0A1Z5KEF1_FISSO|nr:hypothetical protein FisN_2Hu050 [Fistulifera solaris]|eukprot:GAX24461.1 hypothetical protein FisN_2Hu050 [Fistulifera solaris]